MSTPVPFARRSGIIRVPLALAVLSAVGLLLDTFAVESHALGRLDADAALSVHHHLAATIHPLMSALSLAGGPIGTVLLAFIVALLLFLRRAFVAIAAVIASVGLGLALDTLLKLVIHRPRPYLWPHTVAEHSYSFPSGHSTGAGALAVALVYAAWTVGGRVLAAVTSGAVVALALAIGLSRVYLGVHWPTDVVGGLFLGVFSGSIVVLALEWSGLHVKAGLPS